MWRASLFAVLVWAGGLGAAAACENPDDIGGVIFEDIPAYTPPDAIVLDVEFGRQFTNAAMGRIAEARVRRVVRGEYQGRTVRVFLINSSCTDAFMFGTSGLIIGHLREGVEVSTRPATRIRLTEDGVELGERTETEFRFGAEGRWFQPRSESIGARRERTTQGN